MALARNLALRNLQQRFSTFMCPSGEKCLVGNRHSQSKLNRFMASSSGEQEEKESKEVSVSEKKSPRRIFPRRRGRKSLWRNTDDQDYFAPALNGLFPSSLGNALMQATENINRIFDNFDVRPSQLMGQVKEQDDCYKLRYEVPGLTKDDVKITVDNGILMIKGEHKAEEEEGSPEDDEHWSSRSYGYYNTSLSLPDDAKVEEIKAELKNGVLNVVIPRMEMRKKDVQEISVE
ncbi:26.5 kDa heat shock protein [Raphanus sativus]|uniref:26.5 kDa heat shock protein, mitochondrial n=1 Tax=Raphanus sativus TaxID=3726 RepID=A0A6J0LRT3_RAPSA|nr:26.5 kDa heat shock protein, mitochondrial [Raphanus sativus]KAJ4917844.1 26.5 kDa heat shock protein [Raphanus sativus]